MMEGREGTRVERPDDRAYTIRQLCRQAITPLRALEDYARVTLGGTEGSPNDLVANRARACYEKIADDILNGRSNVPTDEEASAPPPSAESARVELVERLEAFARAIDGKVRCGEWPNTYRRADDLREAAAALRTEPASPLSAEEREQAEGWLIELENSAGTNHVGAGRDENFARLLFRLLTLLDQQSAQLATQAKALEAGDELAREVPKAFCNVSPCDCCESSRAALDAYRSLRTTEGGEG